MGFFTDDPQYKVVERHFLAPDKVVLNEVTMDEAKQFVRGADSSHDYVIEHV